MVLWRISNHAELDGAGGLLASGRWHTQGRPVIYLADSAAGALLEVLVRLELDYGSLPRSYKLLKLQAPDAIQVKQVNLKALAEDWTTDLTATRTIGDEWLGSHETALLRVPSAIVPETANLLLNPQHADAEKIQIAWHRSYPWDRRLF